MFTKGFDKIAVSVGWVGNRIGGGLATRAGYSAGSSAHKSAKLMSENVMKHMLTRPGSKVIKSKDISKEFGKTKFSPPEAQKHLQSMRDAALASKGK